MKKICVLAAFLFVAGTAQAYRGEVENIPPREYCDTLIKEIDASTSSVTAYVYLFSIHTGQAGTPSFKLAEALVAAHKREVSVNVVLDQQRNFEDGTPAGVMPSAEKNLAAYEFLRANGVGVWFDEPSVTMHSKAVVIDDRTVIAGSGNWSNTSFLDNTETNVLMRSPEMARDVLASLSAVKRQAAPEEDRPAALLPFEFTTDRKLLSAMLSVQDMRAFDVYLYILKESLQSPINRAATGIELQSPILKDESATSSPPVNRAATGIEKGMNEADMVVKIDCGALAGSLGISDMGRDAYRRQIIKILNKLNGEYNLIDVKFEYNKDPWVILKGSGAGGPKISVPGGYWAYGWDRKLSFPAKIMFLLDLHYSRTSKTPPRWSICKKTLSDIHGVTEGSLGYGITELRRAGLIEVEYADYPESGDWNDREPSAYSPGKLYDPGVLKDAMDALERKYGREKFDRARKCAVLVYADSDVDAMARFAELEGSVGVDKVKKAYTIIAAKNPDNPRRTVGYFFKTIEKVR